MLSPLPDISSVVDGLTFSSNRAWRCCVLARLPGLLMATVLCYNTTDAGLRPFLYGGWRLRSALLTPTCAGCCRLPDTRGRPFPLHFATCRYSHLTPTIPDPRFAMLLLQFQPTPRFPDCPVPTRLPPARVCPVIPPKFSTRYIWCVLRFGCYRYLTLPGLTFSSPVYRTGLFGRGSRRITGIHRCCGSFVSSISWTRHHAGTTVIQRCCLLVAVVLVQPLPLFSSMIWFTVRAS